MCIETPLLLISIRVQKQSRRCPYEDPSGAAPPFVRRLRDQMGKPRNLYLCMVIHLANRAKKATERRGRGRMGWQPETKQQATKAERKRQQHRPKTPGPDSPPQATPTTPKGDRIAHITERIQALLIRKRRRASRSEVIEYLWDIVPIAEVAATHMFH